MLFTFLRFRAEIPGIIDIGLVPQKVNTVAVLGGGLMGSGIATALILSNFSVVLKEVNEKFLEAGIGRIKGTIIAFLMFS